MIQSYSTIVQHYNASHGTSHESVNDQMRSWFASEAVKEGWIAQFDAIGAILSPALSHKSRHEHIGSI